MPRSSRKNLLLHFFKLFLWAKKCSQSNQISSVEVFFASHAVQLLQGQFIDGLDDRVGMPSGTCRTMMETLIDGAKIACSTGSQAVVGVTPENAAEVLMDPDGLVWSGPPGVVAMSAAADVVLSF